MHEVAVATSGAVGFIELPAPGLTKISHWRILHFKLTRRVKAAIKRLQALGRVLFVFELDVHIAYNVVPEILAHVELLELAMLGHLLVDLFVEIVEVLLQLLLVHGCKVPPRGRHLRLGVDPHVLDQDRLRKGGLMVLP